MNLYSIDVRLYATAYIKAETEAEAQAIANNLATTIEFSDRAQEVGDGIEVTGESFNFDMPDVTLSPAMTLVGPDEGDKVTLAEELIPDEIECGQCNGTGIIMGGLSGDGDDEECPVCDGSGMIANPDID